jgi:TRAP-type C4-dicarboxylate transport system permease small subunit
MLLIKAADFIYKIMTPLSKVLVYFGAAFLAIMMFLTTSDVAMRYFFNRPISGAFDLTEYMMAIVFAFGLPYCIVQKGHIKVDIMMEHLSEKVQTIIMAITTPLGLGLFGLIAWQSLQYVQIQCDTNIMSSVLHIPRYPFVAVLFVGYTCFAIVLLADVLKLFAKVMQK